jgi:CTP:molybdopterin cytidylyltransferase MocA
MPQADHQKYPVFVMCGSDPNRRKLLEVIDPEGQYKSKALLPFLGKRLVDWQMEELRKSPYISDLYVIGLDEQDAVFDYPVHYVPSETTADFGSKLSHGLNYLESQGEKPEMIVVSSCDTPAIRQKEIDQFFMELAKCEGSEFILSLVTEEVVEAVFPNSARVVARFKDCNVLPGELYAITPHAIRIQQEIIKAFGKQRRKVNRQVKNINMGPILIFIAQRPRTWLFIIKYVLGSATLEDGEKALSAAFDIQTKGVIIPEAGFGMDMDLPDDYERLEAFVRQTKLAGETGS